MNISYSKYTAFVTNPERFRLYYMLGLTPDDADTPSRLNLGRRRGSCFHAMYEGRDKDSLTAEFGADIVQRCGDMAVVVPDLGALSLVETAFDVPIGDGKHSINGRIDHCFIADGLRIGDFKTTKGTRTKKETSEYLGELATSPQAHFYIKAAAALGYPTELFSYHVVFDRKDKSSEPRYLRLDLRIGAAEVERTMSQVYAACEAIEGLIERVGVERPWPHSNKWPCCGDRFFCGYQGLCGRTLVKGIVPPGFTNRYAEGA